ncbi:MAG: bifunctional riboflavin kinase/FAD synthetase [Alphaproteobacteria bacterium]
MKLFRHHDNLPQDVRGAVVAWGNYDGLHRGHMAVLSQAKQLACELGAPFAVLTTEPHPRQYFNPDAPNFRLMTLRTKARELEEFGVDALFVLSFDETLANTLAQNFVSQVLIDSLAVRHVVTGFNQRFGKDRGGGTDLLQDMAQKEGFGVTVVDAVKSGEDLHSSTLIRDHIREGRPRDAAELMGHYWRVEGRVEMGDQRGRTIGFPTANVDWGDYLEPALGVYAVRVEIEEGDHAGTYDGVANIGRRPTFDKTTIKFEAHIFDFDADIYGNHIAVEIIEFIRAEKKFNGIDELKTQITLDCQSARDILANEG